MTNPTCHACRKLSTEVVKASGIVLRCVTAGRIAEGFIVEPEKAASCERFQEKRRG